MKKVFGRFIDGRGAIGLLVVRFVFGLGLMLHGLPKTKSPFSWMGADATVPGILQFLAVFSEVGGGLALIIGLLTPIAAFGIVCTMLFAIFSVHLANGDPFVGKGGSYESAAGYFAAALLILLAGPGKLSLDALLFGRDKSTAKTIAASVGAES